MAKGNDGNLLQHTIEAETAWWLARHAQQLHVVITHGMAPFEAFEPRKNPSYIKLLDDWLERSKDPNIEAHPQILRAYRKVDASAQHYPNTAELLAAVLDDRQKLLGSVCECDDDIFQRLSSASTTSNLKVLNGSWRANCLRLMAPQTLSSPWMFTMDPYAFTDRDGKDDGWVRENDFAFLSTIIRSYFECESDGAFLFFSYSTQNGPKAHLKAVIRDYILSENERTHASFIETGAKTGVQIATVVTRQEKLLKHLEHCWTQVMERRWNCR
ncbi:hypothetical protein [Novipirellula sp.]|uniref:hypothetical protein n=1 Tax=Novipirellula sp. TaxID=2795430 RepID=UPI0035685DF3